jgi:PhnB protein
MKIISYLTFAGNCRDAMTFYQVCLGGELSFQTIGESPLAGKMPAGMKACILHAQLKNKTLLLLGSDMVGQQGLKPGNAVSLMLQCTSKKHLAGCYEKLSAGGQKEHPVEQTFFGAWMGDLTDRFGNHWLLYFKPRN